MAAASSDDEHALIDEDGELTVNPDQTVDIYDPDFQEELMQFCHFYQIPFQENNTPKTARNAAVIYQKLLMDRESVDKRFEGT